MEFYTNIFARGNKVYYRGYRNNVRVTETVNYKPYLFIPSRKDNNTQYKTLDGKPVDKLGFDSISDARDFLKQYEDVSNMEIYGFNQFGYMFIYDKFPGELNYDTSLINVISLDIETDSSGGFPDINKADKEITAITISRKGEKVVFGMFDYKPKEDNITYIKCKDEWHLLNNFLRVWQSGRFCPDIVTGWNIEFFDIPYLVNRIRGVLGEHEAKKLSPWGFLDERIIEFHGNQNQTFIPAGINVLDYLSLYKKFKFEQQESYKLDSIAEKELGEKKVDYRAEGYTSLNDLYERNFELFIDYNIHDVTLIDRLEEKLKFIEQVIAFAYDAKVNYNDTMTTVKPWDVIVHNYLMDRAIVIPQFKKGKFNGGLVGGHVKDVKTGLNEWVVSFDLNSLYPHLIMQYNISPETKIGREQYFPSIESILDQYAVIENNGYAYAANGVKFHKKKQGFLPALMEKMYNDRTEYKKRMIEAKKLLEDTPKNKIEERRLIANDIAKYHNLQLAKKIQLNSAYGALGNEYFRWFDFDLAEAITMSGQLAIRWIERDFNEYLNKLLKTTKIDYVIASDTDSIYVNMKPLVNMLGITDRDKIVEAVHQFCETKIQNMINKSYQNLADYMCAYQQKMFMKRETIANKAIWKAKKMYILNALDIEGVRFSEPQLKIQGIEAVRSSTPKACRTSIKEAIKIIMNKDEPSLHEYIANFKINFMNMPFEDIAFPRGMKGLDVYKDSKTIYSKGTPIHVRGALLYNNFINKNGLSDDFKLIGNGDKIKFAYLKLPNHFRENVISVPDELPKELGLDKYIDYDIQLQKSFIEPIKSILETIGWEVEKTSTLESFFG